MPVSRSGWLLLATLYFKSKFTLISEFIKSTWHIQTPASFPFITMDASRCLSSSEILSCLYIKRFTKNIWGFEMCINFLLHGCLHCTELNSAQQLPANESVLVQWNFTSAIILDSTWYLSFRCCNMKRCTHEWITYIHARFFLLGNKKGQSFGRKIMNFWMQVIIQYYYLTGEFKTYPDSIFQSFQIPSCSCSQYGIDAIWSAT